MVPLPTFGRTEWFFRRQSNRSLVPTNWQGWTYAAVWLTAIMLPASVLLCWSLIPESLIWIGLATAALRREVSHLRQQMRRAGTPVDRISGTSDHHAVIFTRHYDFYLRQ